MKANKTASQRTRNRLREHEGHGLTEEKREPAVTALKGTAGVFFSCACGWVGWLPESEID